MMYIRNFLIIAHVDHGKSTLADRFIQICDGLNSREMQEQVLDSMDLERERGITIKAQCVTLIYNSLNGNQYKLNFIDTPGHADFSYEVSRSMFACEGAILIVDATQGVEAQTVANCYLASDNNLVIIPVLNKVDLLHVDIERTKKEIEEIIGIDSKNALKISAKSGIGVIDLLEEIIVKIPFPVGDINSPLRSLIIDSWFNEYQGVVSLIRVKDGVVKKGDKIFIVSSQDVCLVEEVGIFTPKKEKIDKLQAGDVGYIIAGIKNIDVVLVGDSIIHYAYKDIIKPLPGFQIIKPKVYAGVFPIISTDYENFRVGLNKLKLNDSSLIYEPEFSEALGFGFRCGFLGLLHMDIVKERLKREYDLDLIISSPTVVYRILTKNGNIKYITNPSKLYFYGPIKEIAEPFVVVTILSIKDYLGNIISVCINRRGIQKEIIYFGRHVSIVYELPMSEVVLDFIDTIKSVSKGFASLEYDFTEYKVSNLVKLDILINGIIADSLSLIMHYDDAYRKGKKIIDCISKIIPKQLFDIVIQASINNNIISRASIKALRKNVIAKCYGGDITRKRKLLDKQKIGKKKMKNIGKVNIPSEAFLAVLKINKEGK
ncbi:MAG: elongation factor 4 [Candidatus Azosocius agrarius]|nr:MAG: elongation factor 4 [Gammaproteobacteria bacterium]